MSKLIAIVAFASLGNPWTTTPSSSFPASWSAQQSNEMLIDDLLSDVGTHLVQAQPLEITRITPTSAVIKMDNVTVFIDPVGSQSQYARFGRPDIVVLTRAGPEHLSIDTMIGMLRRDTVVLAPQAVINS